MSGATSSSPANAGVTVRRAAIPSVQPKDARKAETKPEGKSDNKADRKADRKSDGRRTKSRPSEKPVEAEAPVATATKPEASLWPALGLGLVVGLALAAIYWVYRLITGA